MSDSPLEPRMEILLGRYIDGTIEPGEAEELHGFLREYPEWNRKVREQILMDIDLRNADVLDEFFLESSPVSLPPSYSQSQFGANRKQRVSRSFFQKLLVPGSLAAIVLLGIFCFTFWHGQRNFATITQTTNCLWGDSLTRTSPGTRLGPCTLRLEQGIALIHFDCGVVVSLEGPSVFEITHEKRAFLHSGRLLATVQTQEGKGFVVETPENRIIDHGTKFGVYVPEDKISEVYVLEGNVEVLLKSESAPPLFLKEGQSVVSGNQNAISGEPVKSMLQFNTGTGQGKEGWAIQDRSVLEEAERVFPQGIPDVFMFVKTSSENDAKADRKAIFSIDISSLEKNAKLELIDASLDVTFAPTEIGYASNVPDSRFTVYGLIDETLDEWEPETLDWANFPGNLPRNELRSPVWKPLGSFFIERGSRIGIRRIQGESLADFVRGDTNGLVTFAIVRDTPALEKYGLVHGFANHRHPTLQPPRLQIQTDSSE